ncbi:MULTISPECIES: hypothetical protein [unclassified Yoonia]|uniref:hypothetical protein n=1 Tax=unclassified Yoonia TaxID=2629118 RepID=UPI002AFF7797|nr:MULTISPECIES: hypothetical protein [unclassified Yoonia]
MATEQQQDLTKKYSAAWRWIQGTWLFRWVVWARWILSISLTVAALLWSAYVLGQDISENLTRDYNNLQNAQGTLLQDAQQFRDSLLNPNTPMVLDEELGALRLKAQQAISSLAGLRSPSNRIENAKHEYREALEGLIAVTNRLSRGEIEDMSIPLHNALQSVANEGGEFNAEVSYFQGGMWPQLQAAIF